MPKYKLVRLFFTGSLPTAVFQGALVLIVNLAARFIFKNELHLRFAYVGAIASSVACATFVMLRARFLRHALREVDAYQANEFWQQQRIISSLQSITYVCDQCDHIADPAHQNCRAAVRKELRSIRSSLGKAPMPDIVRGNRDAAVGAD